MSNILGIVEIPSYADFERGPIGEVHGMLVTQDAYMILQDFGPNMLPCLMHIFETALTQDKLPVVISKLKEIYESYKLWWIWPPSIPTYFVEGIEKTIREVVATNVCTDILGIQFDD